METPPRTPRGHEDSFLDGPSMDSNGSDAQTTQLATLPGEDCIRAVKMPISGLEEGLEWNSGHSPRTCEYSKLPQRDGRNNKSESGFYVQQ